MKSLATILLLSFYSMCLYAEQSPIGSIKALYGNPAPIGTSFDLIGQIVFICDEHPRRITLIDRIIPHGICFWDLTANPPTYRNGDLIRVRGFISQDIESFLRQMPNARTHTATNIEVVGHAPMPQTRAATAPEINMCPYSNAFVHVDGALASAAKDSTNAEWNWLMLRTESGPVRAAATEHDYPLSQLMSLLDAEVRLSGIVHKTTTRMRIHRTHVILFGEEGLVVRNPPPDPFAVPTLGNEPFTHRQQVSGRALGTGRGLAFVQSDDHGFVVAHLQDGVQTPTVGDKVCVSGFPEYRQMGFRLFNAVLRVEPEARQAPDDATATDPERMFTTPSGQSLIDTSLYGKVLRIRGRVANSTEGIRTDGRILLECGQRTITGNVGHLLDTLDPNIVSGSTVDLSGVCLFDFDNAIEEAAFPQFKGFVIVPRTAEDIVIVQRPPWWTVGKLICVIAVLALVIIAILVWNRMLKVLSERRGRELADEQITSARADLKVEERTRLAVELHDSISQTLTGVALQIDAAQGSGKSNPAAAERFLETARAMLASCRQELRCCIWDLKNRAFEAHDMTEAIEKTIAPHLGTTQIQVRFNVPRTILSESSAHDILRIVRELVMNAIRHGQAKNIRIAGECRDGTVRFSVRDDGMGFSQANVPGPSQGHFGLQGIRERIGNRNGEMSIRSTPGQGTKITVVFSADERENDES